MVGVVNLIEPKITWESGLLSIPRGILIVLTGVRISVHCGQHHSLARILNHTRWRRGRTEHAFISLCFLPVAVTSGFKLLSSLTSLNYGLE